MARPLRIESSGALYHITSTGNAREAIFFDANDKKNFLDILLFGGKEVRLVVSFLLFNEQSLSFTH